MKGLGYEGVGLGREARIAILVAVLIALGAICIDLGLQALGIVLFVVAVVLASAYILIVVRPAAIPRDATLTLRFADGIRESAPRSPLDQIRSRGMPTLVHIRQALEAAAIDPDVRNIVVEITAPGIGFATAQELHDLLQSAVAKGKRVIAVLSGDSISVRDYLIACGAGEIVANPDSVLMMLGVAVGGFFLKNALEKLQVQAQILQWKEYKGAGEIFTRDGMSPEVRDSLEAIISDWKNTLAENLAQSRKLDAAHARELLGSGFMGVRSACEARLVDRAGYIEDVRAEIAPDGSDHNFVALGRYLRHLNYLRDGRRAPQIALIHGIGPVVAGDPPGTGDFISGEVTAEQIRRASEDQNVRAIVFRVNSPGGSAVGSDLVWRAVGAARKQGKPVVVSMGDVAGSGGYYVAMGADAIVAEPSTITGSIGVVYTKFNVKGLLARIGINTDVAKSDEISDAMSVARAMSEQELAQLNRVVGELYGNFTAKVAEGRKLAAEDAERVARGRVWSGAAARSNGLIDELGGLARAVEIAREKAGFKSGEAHDLVLYPPPGFLAALNLGFARSQTPDPASIVAHMTGIPEQWAPTLVKLLARGGAFLLCPLL